MAATSDTPYILPPAFSFRVLIDGKSSEDTSFTEVTGIGSELETETYKELNENRFSYRLPTTIKSNNLVVKRGIAKNTSPLVKWCTKVLDQYAIPIEVKEITVSLLNAKGQSSRMWVFHDAYPIKWQVEGFSAKKNEIAIETIEFAFTYSERFF